MTDILIEVSEVLTTTVNASAVIATLEVTAGIGGPQGPPGQVPIPLTIRGNLTVGVGVVPLPIVQSGTLVDVLAAVATAPTGADLVFDIKRNGISLLHVTILAGQKTSDPNLSLSIPLVAGDTMTVDILQIGSPVPGAYATIVLVVA